LLHLSTAILLIEVCLYIHAFASLYVSVEHDKIEHVIMVTVT